MDTYPRTLLAYVVDAQTNYVQPLQLKQTKEDEIYIESYAPLHQVNSVYFDELEDDPDEIAKAELLLRYSGSPVDVYRRIYCHNQIVIPGHPTYGACRFCWNVISTSKQLQDEHAYCWIKDVATETEQRPDWCTCMTTERWTRAFLDPKALQNYTMYNPVSEINRLFFYSRSPPSL
jgi:hypothetical protein